MAIALLFSKLKPLFSGRFIRNVGWIGGSELVIRIFRLVTTFTLARMFSSTDYGLVAIVYTVNDFANVFSIRHGIGAKIIQVDDQHLKAIADTSYWLNWLLCIAIFVVQCIIAFPVAWFYGESQLVLPICVLGIQFLILPFYAVNSALIQRENRLNIIALGNTTQSVISNILTAILALLGFGVWAVVLPIILSNPIWIWITRKYHSWRPPKDFQLKQWREILRFGSNMLGVELMARLRGNLDYLLIGRFVGIEELGLYYFAFNAGLGISMSVGYMLLSPLFPHLCEVRKDYQEFKSRYFHSLKTIAVIFIPLILLQAGLAPFYVPIVFGEKWIPAIPILVMICLSAIPRPFSYAASLLLDSVDRTRITLYFDTCFTIIFALIILLAIQWGIYWVAFSVLISHVLILPIFTVLASRYVLNRHAHFCVPAKPEL